MPDYWFDGTNGTDSNNGLSAGAPKRAIDSSVTVSGACALHIKRGTTVQLTADRYPTGTFTLRPYGEGAARARVVFTGSFQLTHTGIAGTRYTVEPGMWITAEGTNVNGLSTREGALYVDDVLIDSAWNGVVVGAGGGYVRNSRISGVRNNGVNVGWAGGGYAAPSNVEVVYNHIDATGGQSDPISYHDGTGTANGGLIGWNTCIGGGDNGIGIETPFNGVMVIGNRVENAYDMGIVTAGTNCVTIGNFITGAGGSGLSPSDEAEGGGSRFCGNIVYNCGRARDSNGLHARTTASWVAYNNTFIAGPESAMPRMISFPNAGVTGTLRNNIVVARGTQRYVEVFDANAALFLLTNNLYFGSSSATPFAVSNGSARTWAQWTALTALGGGLQDVNSLTSDPLLDASFRPREGSPCIGAGVYIPGVRHMGGKKLKSVPDIGAYRYAPVRSQSLIRVY